jgi:hypothetical protein
LVEESYCISSRVAIDTQTQERIDVATDQAAHTSLAHNVLAFTALIHPRRHRTARRQAALAADLRPIGVDGIVNLH